MISEQRLKGVVAKDGRPPSKGAARPFLFGLLNRLEQNKVCGEKKGSSAEGAGGAPYLLWFTKKFVGGEK